MQVTELRHDTPFPGFAALAAETVDTRPWEPFPGAPHVQVKYLFTAAGSVAGLMRLDPHASEATHAHAAAQHHLWLLEGAVHVEGRRVATGGYLHIPEGMPHTMHTQEEGCTFFFVHVRQGEPAAGHATGPGRT